MEPKTLDSLELQDTFDIVNPAELLIPEAQPKPGLIASMEAVGLLEPPLVKGKTVLHGTDRVRAALALGKQTILIRSVTSEIAVYHQRLVGKTRTVLSVAEDVAAWKSQHETDFPETKKGGNQKVKKEKKEQTGTVPFWRLMETYKGWSQTKTEQLVLIGSLPADERKEIRKNENLANHHRRLLEIARWKPETKNVGKVNRTDLIKEISLHPTWPAKKIEKRLVHDWYGTANEDTLPAKPGDPVLYLGDFETVMAKMEPESVDLVFTDPLWEREWLPNLPRLAATIHRILKPTGIAAIFYTSHFVNRLFRAMDDVFGEELLFDQFIDYQGAGSKQPYDIRGIQNKYKPIVIYEKVKWQARDRLELAGNVDNVIRSEGKANKLTHEYNQSYFAVTTIVKTFSKPGNLVLDCCVGGGTSLMACLETGRQFIGIDIGQEAINICQNLLNGWKQGENPFVQKSNLVTMKAG